MLQASGLLPERPGGWISDVTNESPSGIEASEPAAGVEPERGSWQWIERERKKGLEYARHFNALHNLHGRFDGGEDGAIGRFLLG